MTGPQPTLRPPLLVLAHDPQIADLLNHYQLLYMAGIIEAEALDPDALGDWLRRQPSGFNVALYCQNLLIKYGFKRYEINPPEPPPNTLHARSWQDYNAQQRHNRRTVSMRDLLQSEAGGWVLLLRVLNDPYRTSAIFYATCPQGYLAYHPLHGLIVVQASNLGSYDPAGIQAVCRATASEPLDSQPK